MYMRLHCVTPLVGQDGGEGLGFQQVEHDKGWHLIGLCAPVSARTITRIKSKPLRIQASITGRVCSGRARAPPPK